MWGSAVGEAPLPPGFEELEAFGGWALPSETARAERRRGSTFEALRAFYDAIAPRAEAALAALEGAGLEGMGEGERRLFEMCLAYAEVAPFIEQFGRCVVPEQFDERRFVPQHE